MNKANIMKMFGVFFLLLASAVGGFAQYVNVEEAAIAEGSPEARAVAFAKAAQAGDLVLARSMVSDDLYNTVTLHGSQEEDLIKRYKGVDFTKLFQYRIVWPDQAKYPDECIITFRFLLADTGKRFHTGYSLKKIEGKWVLVADNERKSYQQ